MGVHAGLNPECPTRNGSVSEKGAVLKVQESLTFLAVLTCRAGPQADAEDELGGEEGEWQQQAAPAGRGGGAWSPPV